MSDLYQVSVSPHVRSGITTRKIMGAVVVALLPSALLGIYNFGFYALLILLVAIASAVFAEYLYERLMKKPVTIGDLSAVVTGLLVGMNMPPSAPWWVPCIGSAFAIIFVKMLFGGLGQNFMNPALAGRCFLLISFSSQMSTFTAGSGFSKLVTVPAGVDAISGATPLAYLKAGQHFDLSALFAGNTLGVIGETSAAALLLGGIFLAAVKIIDARIPLAYLGSFAVLVLITAAARGISSPLLYTAEELCAGGLMLGAWFMATDYVTSPITKSGRLIYGLLLGFLTWVFRMIGKGSEGVSYAIIFINCLVPMIEHYTRPRALGISREKKKGGAK